MGISCMKSWTTKSGINITRLLSGRGNCYLLTFGDNRLLVDTGKANKWTKLNRQLERLGVKKESMRALILTHSHFDHAENAALIKENYGAPLVAQRLEVEFLARGENPPIRGTFVVTQWMTNFLLNPWTLRLLRYTPVKCDIVVDDSLDLVSLGFPACILHTSGHSPGSISVIVDDEIALVGDTMFGVWKGSVFPPFAADPELMIKSWAKLLATHCRVFLPGHGGERSRALLQHQYDYYCKKFKSDHGRS
jgi:hydroxyacylglutathione hydrolase